VEVAYLGSPAILNVPGYLRTLSSSCTLLFSNDVGQSVVFSHDEIHLEDIPRDFYASQL
jgi:hypothetical protein